MSGMGSIMSPAPKQTAPMGDRDRLLAGNSNPIPSVVRMSVNDYDSGGDFDYASPKSPQKQATSPVNAVMRSATEQNMHGQPHHPQQMHQQLQQPHGGRQAMSTISNTSGTWNNGGDLHQQNSNMQVRQVSSMQPQQQVYQPGVSQQYSSYNCGQTPSQLHRPSNMDPNAMPMRYVAGGVQVTEDGYYVHNGMHHSAPYNQQQGHWDRNPNPYGMHNNNMNNAQHADSMDGMYDRHMSAQQQHRGLTTTQSVDSRNSPGHNRNQIGETRRPMNENWYPGPNPQQNRYETYPDMQQQQQLQAPTPASMTQYRWFLTIPLEMQGDSEEEQKKRRDYIHTFFERQPDGAWLVRYNHRKNQFVLSILFGGLVLHMNIASQGNEFVLDNHRFPSIPALTDYYQNNNISGKIATPLTVPIPCIRTDPTNYVLVE